MTRKRATSASQEWFGRLMMPEATGTPPFGFRGTGETATFYNDPRSSGECRFMPLVAPAQHRLQEKRPLDRVARRFA